MNSDNAKRKKCYPRRTAACSFVIAVLAYVFIAQEEKVESLEQRVKELEEKNSHALAVSADRCCVFSEPLTLCSLSLGMVLPL